MLDIYQEVQRQRGEEYLNLVSVSSVPHLKAADSRKEIARFRRLAEWSWKPKASFYEGLSDEDRIVALGSCLAASPRWEASHGRQVAWLQSQGLTTKDAVRRYKEWRAAQAARFENATAEPLGDAQHSPVRNGRRKRRGPRSRK